MKRTENSFAFSIIAAAVVSLLAGCATVPSADISADVQDELFAESKTYNGGE